MTGLLGPVRAHGLFGYVRANDRRTAALFALFLLAFHLAAAVGLLYPLTLLDPQHSLIFDWRGYATRYVPALTLAGALLFALQLMWHVRTVRAKLDFRRVGRREELRVHRIVERTAIAMGLPMPGIGLVESPVLNSFACGFYRANAVVVLTRGLVDALDDDELTAVVAHELVHIRNGDIRLMAAVNILKQNLWAVSRLNRLRFQGFGHALVVLLFAPAFMPFLLFGGFFGESAFRLGLLSRLLIAASREFVADAEAVRITHNPEALIAALRRIDGRSTLPGLPPELDAMMFDGAAIGADANHPPVAERIAALAALVRAVPAGLAQRPAPAWPGDATPSPVVFGRRNAAPAKPLPKPALPLPPLAWPEPTLAVASLPPLQRVTADTDRSIFGFQQNLSFYVFVALALGFAFTLWFDANGPLGFAMRWQTRGITDMVDKAVAEAGRASQAGRRSERQQSTPRHRPDGYRSWQE